MFLILRDSTNPFDIPIDGLAAVAGYGDGRYVWSSQGWARFGPPIVPLSIVVSAASAGDILDVETGDATPGDCPGWADRFDRPGRRRPTIYCNRATIGAVRAAMGPRAFDWWAATLDGTVIGTYGAVAVQWKGSDRTGGHFDETIIVDPGWIGAKSQPKEAPKMGKVMLRPIGADGQQDGNGVVWDGPLVLELLADGTTEILAGAGVPIVPVPVDFVNRLKAAAAALAAGRVVVSGNLTATLTGTLTPPPGGN